MPVVNLKNFTIKEKQDIQNRTYYLIIDNESDNAYFCFSGAVKSGWNDLINWSEIKEIEIEYQTNERGNNKVVGIYTFKDGEIFV